MPSFTKIDVAQPDNWHLVFQSEKEVPVTSFEIVEIQLCAQSNKTERKAISFKLACFEAEKDTYLSWIVTGDETWVRHFEAVMMDYDATYHEL